MSGDDPGRQRKEAQNGSSFLSSLFTDLLSQAVLDGLPYVIVGLFRGAGTLLEWILESLPW